MTKLWFSWFVALTTLALFAACGGETTPDPPACTEDWHTSAMNSCNLLCQDCDGAGEACDFISPDTIEQACRPAGAGKQGTPCTSPEECAAGFGCYAVANAPGEVCQAYCEPGAGGANGCPEGTRCALYRYTTGSALGLCTTRPPPDAYDGGTCAPLLPVEQNPCDVFCQEIGCAAGEACVRDQVIPGEAESAFVCAAAGTGSQGANCTDQGDCAPGFECASYPGQTEPSPKKCQRYCRIDTGAPPSCDADEECRLANIYVGESLGLCF